MPSAVKHAAAGGCSCEPSYRGYQWSERDQKTIRGSWSRNLAEAKGWRDDARSASRKGAFRAPTSTTIREAGEAWLNGAREGAIRNRSGHPYKPSTIRGYEQSLRLHIYPELGPRRLSDVRRSDLQAFVDRILTGGADPSSARNALMPLRVIYRYALARDQVAMNPTLGLEMPAARGRRERVASPAEAEAQTARIESPPPFEGTSTLSECPEPEWRGHLGVRFPGKTVRVAQRSGSAFLRPRHRCTSATE